MTPLIWTRAKLQLTFLHALSTVPTFQATIFLDWLCGWIGSLNELLIIRVKRQYLRLTITTEFWSGASTFGTTGETITRFPKSKSTMPSKVFSTGTGLEIECMLEELFFRDTRFVTESLVIEVVVLFFSVAAFVASGSGN